EIDLDELLAEPSDDKNTDDAAPSLDDDVFADTDLDTNVDAGTELPAFDSDDPFADLGGETPSTGDELGASDFDSDDLFGETKPPETGIEDDPFSDLGGESGEPADLTDDPFADLGGEAPSTGDDFGSDDFGTSDFGSDDFATGSTEDSDSNTEMDDLFGDTKLPEAGLDDDPFADLGGADDTIGAEPMEDPFSDLGTDMGGGSGMEDTSFGDGAAEDPFGDLGVDLASAPMEDSGFDEPVSDLEPPSFDDIGGMESSFDDLEPPDLDEIGETSSGLPVGDGVLEDELSSLMEEEEGSVEDGLTDEDLAIIQREIVKYPPKLRRQVIDSIVNNRIPVINQKELIEIIKHEQPPEDVAAYLSSVLGEEVPLRDTSRAYSDDGVPIISTNPIYTKEGALRRRKLVKNTLIFSTAAILFIASFISLYKYVIVPGRASGHYEEGLEAIRLYSTEKDETEKKRLLRVAKEFFVKGEEIHPHSLKYLNAYGVAYMKAGRYEDSFEKIFGKVEPPFQNWSERTEVPYIGIHPDSRWDDRSMEIAGTTLDKTKATHLTSQDRVKRKILKPGAYIVARVKEDIHDITTYNNLGRFHSFHARDFIEDPKTKTYKNDTLAIEYFKRIFTDANQPSNIDARAGIAKIYYNRKEFPKAASEYNKIVEIYPKNSIGHGGLLSSYIEIWRRDGNPQFVLNHHRNIKNKLGIEKDLSLFILSKLASFYIDLDPEETRVRYNVTPEDQVTDMDIDDNAAYLLSILFGKEETVDDKTIPGNKYAEGYYQRGRLFLKKNEALRAMKQFELAASYDVTHYPAVLRMAEYYMGTSDFPEAENLLKSAEKRYKDFQDKYGRRDEDETLMNGDPGRIYFNRGKILYVNASGILEMDQIKEFPGRKIYPERAWSKIPDTEMNRRRRGLYLSSEFFKLANTKPHVLKDEKKTREMIYYEGWIDYMLGNFQDAMNRWNDLGEDDLYHNTTLLMGMGNASYYTKQYNSALGYYKKIVEDYEAKEAMIKSVMFEDQGHQEIYQILVAVHNNMGAVYESQGNMEDALRSYWKAIEIARKIELVSEIANSNKDLIMKKQRLGNQPLLEDWLSPTLDSLLALSK
ncbi:MAG: hypothetical protein JJT78_13245, partial [Leptospira sp.]|nr:hypothetical protein [Leptospira sp.]